MSLGTELAVRLRGTVVVVGIGNPLRGDDAAGSLLARRLCSSAGVQVIDAEDVPEAYLGRIKAARPDTVVLVDAIDFGAPPGAIALLEPGQLAERATATHSVPLDLLAGLIARETRAQVLLLAIQPFHVGFGNALNEDVAASVAALAVLLDHALAMSPAERAATLASAAEGSFAC
jgi:hydrogenase 3 maturation protease